jgi:LysM repeat protein
VIAYKYGLKVPEIMALNCMTDSNKLRIGQKLLLPGKINIDAPKRHVAKKAKVSEAEPKAEEATEATETAGEYTVAKGDILSRIASKHGTTVAAIKKANALTSDKLRAGQKLMVPGAAPKKEKAAAEAVTTEEKTDADTASQPDSNVKTPEMTPTPVGEAGVIAPVSGPVKSASAITYTVEPGDDIVKIATRWGVKPDDIKKANNITDDKALTPGKVLTIP